MLKRPDFVNFVLEDTHSRVLKKYIELLENKINYSIKFLEDKSFLDIEDIRELLDLIGCDSIEL